MLGQEHSHLDNGHYKARDISEFAHVDSEVLELVLLGLFEDQLGALAHGMDAAQVAGGVERWIWGLGQRDVWKAGRARAIGSGSRRAQRAIGTVGLAAVRRNLRLGALAIEETHAGRDDWKTRCAGRSRFLAKFAGE